LDWREEKPNRKRAACTPITGEVSGIIPLVFLAVDSFLNEHSPQEEPDKEVYTKCQVDSEYSEEPGGYQEDPEEAEESDSEEPTELGGLVLDEPEGPKIRNTPLPPSRRPRLRKDSMLPANVLPWIPSPFCQLH